MENPFCSNSSSSSTSTTTKDINLLLPKRSQQVEELFNLLDTDKSGTLEVKELVQLMKVVDSHKSVDDIKKDFKFMDDSKDGKVQKTEFSKHYLDFHAKEGDNEFYQRVQRKIKFLERKPALAAVFDKFDHDKSGNLDKGEVYHMLKLSKFKVTNEEVVELMKKIDHDHDGKVVKDEFIRYFFHQYYADTEGQFKKHLDALSNGLRKVKLQMVFNAYDLDGNGALDMNEFGRMLRLNGRLEDVVSGDDILDVLLKIDSDHDRKVEFPEWLGFVSPLMVSMDDHAFNKWCHAFLKASKSDAKIKNAKSLVSPLIDASHKKEEKKDDKKKEETKKDDKKEKH